MQDLAGRVAIVTGAGSGIGRGIARALAAEGMRVAAADIDRAAAEQTAHDIARRNGEAIGIGVDVSSLESVEGAAREVERAFGKLHIAVNNAGVAMHGTRIEQIEMRDWDWVIGVNVYGVIHGIRAFLPLIRKHGEGGHVVNTASIGGLQVNPAWYTAAYSMTKYAVVALSEGLHNELTGAGEPIGVSVFCPAAVNTQIAQSARNRPDRFGGPYERPQNASMGAALVDGMSPDRAGDRVLRAIKANELFVFSHSAPRAWIEARHQRLMAAFDRAVDFERDA